MWSSGEPRVGQQTNFRLRTLIIAMTFLITRPPADPCKIKCFDEAGLKMPHVANPNYGHSAVVKRYIDAPNVEGLLCADTVDGATTARDFLEFFGEVSNNFLPNGQPVLRYGDHILLDNHARGICFGMVDGTARNGSCLFTNKLTRIYSYRVSFQQNENRCKTGEHSPNVSSEYPRGSVQLC